MYHALLTNRYLTSRVIPLIAVAAVALCVALVIIVVSVMTGFLNMVKASGRTLMGDVVVAYPISGIPYYERLIRHIASLPEASAATPVADNWGLLKMPYPEGPIKQTETVQIWGIEPQSFARVTGYEDALYWPAADPTGSRTLREYQWNSLFDDVLRDHWPDVLDGMSTEQRLKMLDLSQNDQGQRERLGRLSMDQWQFIFESAGQRPQMLKQALSEEQWQTLLAHDPRLLDPTLLRREALTLRHGEDDRTIVLGMHVSKANARMHDGSYEPRDFGYWWMPRFQVTLTTLPITGGTISAQNAESRILQVVNEFVSGVYLIDEKRVMVPLSIAQSMLHLDQAERADDPDDPTKVTGIDPARATMVLVRAADGVTPERLRDAVERAYDDFIAEVAADPALVRPPRRATAFVGGASINTWAQQQAQFIGPVEKERELMRTLFSIVYLVCAGLVLAIFWAIVHEKTRDIGILRSVGASRVGISWIFLRYGLVVGVLGSAAGLGLATLIVRNINVIHETLGSPPLWLAIGVLGLAAAALVITIVRSFSGRMLPVVLGVLITLALGVTGGLALWLWRIGGVVMWDPAVYYFTKIPNQVDMNSAYITMVGAVVFSLIGAFLPAAKAADTDPVQALRYE